MSLTLDQVPEESFHTSMWEKPFESKEVRDTQILLVEVAAINGHLDAL